MLRHIQSPRGRLTVGVCLALGLALVLWKWFYRDAPPLGADPLLHTPQLAFARLEPGTPTYYDRAARPELLRLAPELLAAEDRDVGSERSQAFGLAQDDPALWRKLDRQYRFDAVLLVGDPAGFRPLLDHLRASTDWVLTYLDHTSLIYRRAPAEAWRTESLAAARAQFARSARADRLEFLVQAGLRLQAVGARETARELFEEALDLDEKSPAAWTGLALTYVRETQWATALDKVDRALAANPDYEPALAVKAQTLFSMGKFNVAYPISQRLVGMKPRDPTTLFLHAKIAHEAHAFTAEARTLETLIALAQAAGKPVSGYQIYLGQAYGTAGKAGPAVAAFEAALESGEVTPEQEVFLRESIARIKSRAALP